MSPTRQTTTVLRGLNPAQVECIVLQAADGLLVLDAGARIREQHFPGPMGAAAHPGWLGQPLSDVVCHASRAKLPAILQSDACTSEKALRWRHVNLQRPGTEPLPVLVKCAVVDDAQVLLLRDLRPTVDLQMRFQRAMIELEQSYQRLGRAGSIADRAGSDTAGVARGVVEDMLEAVGTRPMQQIVSEAVQVLERLCIRQALRQSPDDADAAARLLGLTRTELDRLSRMN